MMKKYTCLLALLGLLYATRRAALAGTAWAPLGPSTCAANNEGGNFAQSVKAVENPDNGDFYMAVGSSTFTETYLNQGKVQLYKFDTGSCVWRKEHFPVIGSGTEDRLGYALALSCDANTMAVSGDLDNTDMRAGFVQVYKRQVNSKGQTEWVPKGTEIVDNAGTLDDGTREKDFGFHLELNCGGNVLVVMAYGYYQVYVFDEATQEWRKSDPIYQRNEFSQYNYALGAMARDTGNTARVAIVPVYDESVVQVFDIDGTSFFVSQQGSNITRASTTFENTSDFTDVKMVALSDSGTRLAITFESSSFDGFAVFDFIGGAWQQVGNAVSHDGDGLSMNREGTRVAVQEGDADIMIYEFFEKDNAWAMVGQTLLQTRTDGVDVLGSGSVVVADHGSYIQAYFYQEGGRIDCYPDYEDPDALTCVESDGETQSSESEEERVVVNVKGDTDISGGGAAALAIACVAFVGLVAVGVFLFLGRKSATTRRSTHNISNGQKASDSTHPYHSDDEIQKTVLPAAAPVPGPEPVDVPATPFRGPQEYEDKESGDSGEYGGW